MTLPNHAMPTDRWRALATRYLGVAVGDGVIAAPWRNALFALFVTGILAYGAAFAWYMLERFDLVNLLRDVNLDDSFYYFQIARNLAEGQFSTFDGGITRTNGYHPLWLVLITPFYWVFDKEAALFAIKAFEIMLVAGGAALIAVAVRLAGMPWILLLAVLPTLYQRDGLFAGLEAAAALFMLGLFSLALCLYARDPARWRWPLAAIAFALPWVRLEYVAISLAAMGALCLVEWSRQDPPPPGARVRSAFSAKATVPLLSGCAGILVYFAYNGLAFGGIVPVSAALKQLWSQRRWENRDGYSLTQNFLDTLQIDAFGRELPVALEVCAYLLLVWWFARRSQSRTDWLLLVFLVGMFGLAAGHLAKFAQSVLTIHPSWGWHSWYFVPGYLMMALIVPVRCYVAIYLVRRFIGPGPHRAAAVLRLGIVVAGAVFLLAKADFTSPFRLVDSKSRSTDREWEATSYMGTLVMDRMLPEDSVIGSTSAGVIGYFSRFPVVGLDGLVNSYDYMRALLEGNATMFRRQYGITHFAGVADTRDSSGSEMFYSPRSLLFEGPPYRDRSGERQFRLWSKEPPPLTSPSGFDRSAKFWQKMTPHFDYVSDSIAVIVDNNMVQAFARGCGPTEIRDRLLTFSWLTEEGEPVSRAWRPWADAGENSLGFCANTMELPNDARSPIRIWET